MSAEKAALSALQKASVLIREIAMLEDCALSAFVEQCNRPQRRFFCACLPVVRCDIARLPVRAFIVAEPTKHVAKHGLVDPGFCCSDEPSKRARLPDFDHRDNTSSDGFGESRRRLLCGNQKARQKLQTG